MGTNFSHFQTLSAGTDAIFVMLRLQSFDLYSGKLVIDSFQIVKLLQICYRLVIQLDVDLL